MDMQTKHPEQLIFHLTGQRQGDGVAPIDALALRPALLGAYRDLSALRHDFPVVLVDADGGDFVRPLSSLVDAVLQEVAPRGIDGERMRRHGLQLEREIRTAVAAGARGTLAQLWDAAAQRLGEREGETLEQVLHHTAGALPVDGEVLDCTPQMPAQLLTRAWRAATRAKAQRFGVELSRLAVKLSDILRAARSHSLAGRTPQALTAELGGAYQAAFDFDALARIVGKGAPQDELPPARRARIERALHVLETQRFHRPAGDVDRRARDRPALCRGRARPDVRRVRRACARRRRPGAVPRLPGVHPARSQRRARERQADGDAVVGAAGEGAGAGLRPA